MDDPGASDSFIESEVEPIIQSVLQVHLKNTTWDEGESDRTLNDICEDLLSSLADLKKPFKYVGAWVYKLFLALQTKGRNCEFAADGIAYGDVTYDHDHMMAFKSTSH